MICFDILSLKQNKVGKRRKETDLTSELRSFCDNFYTKLDYNYELDKTNLNQILAYTAKQMETCINNNIMLHFPKYINKYITSYFREEIDKYKGKKLNDKEKKLFANLKLYMKNIAKKLLHCEEYNYTHHKDLFIYMRDNLLPKIDENNNEKDEDKKNHYYNLKSNTQSYIPYMIKINEFIESKGHKMFDPSTHHR